MEQDPNQQYGQAGEQSSYQSGYRPQGDYQQSAGYGQTYEQQSDAGSQQQQYSQQQYGQSARWQTYNTNSAHGPTSLGLAANISAALSYVFGWITGLFFLLAEQRNRFVRFHAMQSILVFIALSLAWAVVRILSGVLLIGWLFGCVLTPLLGIASFLIWAGLIIMAFLGRDIRVPFIGDLAARLSGHDR
jgi:uncharacterized membrane protein